MIKELGLRESDIPVSELPGWSKPEKVLVRVDRPERLPGLQALAPGAEIIPVSSPAEAALEAADAQVLIGYCDSEILAAAPFLHWIQVYSSGVEHCLANPGMHQGSKVLTNGQRIGW